MVGNKLARFRQLGLTLVELLVVIVILALASSVVLLSAPPLRPAVRDDAEGFAARVQSAFDEMVTSGRILRVKIDASGYEIEALQDGGWAAPADNRLFRRRAFDKRTTIAPEIEDAANANARALGVEEEEDDAAAEDKGEFFAPLDPLGAQLPFVVRFSSADGAFIVAVDEGAKVTVREDARAR